MFDDTLIRSMLGQASRIAIIGAKDKPDQPVDSVGRYLLEHGYEIFPVHPVRKSVWGLPAVASLAELPVPVDIVDLFRAPEFCPGHAREVMLLPWRPRLFWMQLGIRSSEVHKILAGSEIIIVEDHCIKVEHSRLLPTAYSTQGL